MLKSGNDDGSYLIDSQQTVIKDHDGCLAVQVVGAVSGTTDYLVAGSGAGSKIEDAAAKGVEVNLSESVQCRVWRGISMM